MEILGAILDRRLSQDEAVRRRRESLEIEKQGVLEKLQRLYRAIEDGVVDLEPDLQDPINHLKLERDRIIAALDRVIDQTAHQGMLTPERVRLFGDLMREKMQNGDIQARKAYLRSVIDRIEVDDKAIRIIGDTNTLAAAVAGRPTAAANVRGFVRKWRASIAKPRTRLSRSWPTGTLV
ncbi:MAG: hypothetical protein U1E62_18545 [Alsobacter sp.]